MSILNFNPRWTSRLHSKMTSASTANNQNKDTVWTVDNIVKSPFPNVEIPKITVSELIWKNVDKWADKTAVVCALTNNSYTFRELRKRSRNFAVRLRTRFNLQDNDVVCVMMPNCPEYCIAILGTLESGAIASTMNPIFTCYEISKHVDLCEPKIIIVSTETIDDVRDGLKLAKKAIPVIVVKQGEGEELPTDTVSFNELIDEDIIDHSILNEVRITHEDVALMPFSSGTTGFPKCVELTHYNLVANIIQSNADKVAFTEKTTDYHQDVVLCVLPFYHAYGLLVLMLQKLAVGVKLVTLPKFHPDTYLAALKDYKVSLLSVVPPMVQFLGSYPDCTKEHLQYVNRVTCGAAPIAIHDIQQLIKKLPPSASFTQLYGLTEISPLGTTEIKGSTDYVSSGYALPNTELKIIGPKTQALGPGEVGEIYIRGPQIMKGYRNNEEATRNTITKDGWLRTGDLGVINQNGALYIKDRLKEIIKVNGHQVPPAELESILKEHPAISDAAVLGVPDQKTGEAPKAFIELKEGYEVDEKQIIEFINEKITKYKWIREVVFIDKVPRNPSGKILKRILKERYCSFEIN